MLTESELSALTDQQPDNNNPKVIKLYSWL